MHSNDSVDLLVDDQEVGAVMRQTASHILSLMQYL